MGVYNPLYTQYLMDKHGVGWFKFDESVSTSLLDSKGTSSGVITGTTVVEGVTGNARSFNGVSDKIIFDSKIIPMGKKSIRLRVKKNSVPTVAEYILMNSMSVTAEFGMLVYFNTNGTLSFDMTKGNNVKRFSLTSSISVCDNQWHDILFTWDGTTNANGVKLYIDDMTAPNSSTASESLEVTQPSKNLHLGMADFATVRFASFIIDSLEIYNDVIEPIPNKILLLGEERTSGKVLASKYTEDITPNMTNPILPSGVVTASESRSDRGEAFNIFNNSTGAWKTANSSPSLGEHWVVYDFGQGELRTIEKISLTSAVALGSSGIWSNEFKLYASTDGVVFDLLYQGTHPKNLNEIEYKIDSKKPYRMYRLHLAGGAYIALSSFKMFEARRYLVKLSSQSEQSFINHGMSQSDLASIDMSADFTEKHYIQDESTPLGEGKVFEQVLDVDKVVKKVTVN